MASRWKARVQRVAFQLGACPVHGTPLECVCQYSWTGTEAEWVEVVPLVERLAPYFDQIRPSGRICRCGEALWCRECYEGAARQVVVPPDLFTPAEVERYGVLLSRLEVTSPRPCGLKKGQT